MAQRRELAFNGGPRLSITTRISQERLVTSAATVDLAGWIGGTGPYRVQKATNLTLAEWQDYLTNAMSPALIDLPGEAGFYRIVEP
jgi:hypothetical protein